ncbi:TRAP transporter substrate-binding protein [Alcaligenaceae bacterium CGII-47]|nr:TRAP transporter substrate-binding protein [Alcaligenaceae bacterium CGII-47]
MRNSILGGTLKLCVGIALAVAAFPAAAEQWNIPTRANESNYFTQNITQFAEDVKAKTAGKLSIVVHPEDSLFKQPDVKRAVQTGQVQLGEILMSLHSNENPLFGIDSIPFLTPSLADSKRLLQLSQTKIAAALDKQGLKLLFTVPYPPNAFYLKDEIESVYDLKGVKFRAFNAATARLAELMGATPVTVQQAEVSQAFSTGVIQAMITAAATGVDTHAWEYVKHYYQVNAMTTWNIVFVNKGAFEKLDEPVKKALLDASAQAESRGWARAGEILEEMVAILKKNGMVIHQPNEQMRAEFAKIGATMSAEWVKSAGQEGQEILDAFNAGR